MKTDFYLISSVCFLTGLSAMRSGKPPIITLEQVTIGVTMPGLGVETSSLSVKEINERTNKSINQGTNIKRKSEAS